MQRSISDIHKLTLRKKFLSKIEVKELLDYKIDRCFDVRLLNELLFHVSFDELLAVLNKFSYYNPVNDYIEKRPSRFSIVGKINGKIRLSLVGSNVFHFMIPYLILNRIFDIKVVWVKEESFRLTQNLVNKFIIKILSGIIVNRDELTSDKMKEIKDSIVFHKLNFIISKRIIDFYSKGIINDHWGTLPYYRGRSTFEYQTLFNHRKMFTNHLISVGIDSGEIICYTKCGPIIWWSKYFELYKRIKLSTLRLSGESDALYPNIISKGATFYKMHSDLSRLLKYASLS